MTLVLDIRSGWRVDDGVPAGRVVPPVGFEPTLSEV